MKFKYEASSEITRLLRDFNGITDHCIRRILELKTTSVSALHRAVYKELKDRYDYNTRYFISAYQVAKSVLRSSKRRKRAPIVRKLFIRFSPLLTKFDGEVLRISVRPREFLYVPLAIGEYQRKSVDAWKNAVLKIGMITMDESYVIIPFKRKIEWGRANGTIAFDINEKCLVGVNDRNKCVTSICQKQSGFMTATSRDEGEYREG
ncbi:TPA: hypothetical protein EYP44_04620 [Candidatus Bathyarchaeota archaeon]|nr:hypothetical protein [Candidatus Bathyarchaeota archaeon]